MSDPFGFGRDISCAADFDPMMREVEGLELFAQELLRRLSTPASSLPDDENYGHDAREDCSAGMTPEELAALPGRYQSQLAQDDRVSSVTAKLVASTRDTCSVQFFIESARGPFRFTVDVSRALVTIKEGTLGAVN